MMRLTTSVLCLFAFLCVATVPVTAALPPEVKEELSALSKELRTVTSLLRKKEVNEARALVKKATDRFEELKIDKGERDRTLSSFLTALKRATNQLPVSFEQQVAPILKDKCLNCHGGDNPRANLSLETFDAIRRSSQAKPVIVPRAPVRSLLYARISTQNAQLRMPKNKPAMDAADSELIGRWISQGAIYDGTDVTAAIGSSKPADSMESKKVIEEVKVVMADGSETVSFQKDIAPWMVNVCMRCHTGDNARNGYRVTTFEDILRDGETGSTILPGDPDGSYIVDLVLRQDPLKMPVGNQVRLKRSQAKALETWIKEGAHFDGKDPKAPIRSLVPTAAELAAQALTSMPIQEFEQRRRDQAVSLWKQVNPREASQSVETKDLIVFGNIAQSRLQEFADIGQAQVTALATKYKFNQAPWRGRLIVFATKSRFGYEEFNTVLMNNRRTPRGVSGHVFVTTNVETAYIAMHDLGDSVNDDTLAAKPLLKSLIAQAFLVRNGQSIPDWLRQGFGIIESGEESESPYLKQIPLVARTAVASISNPATLFDNGTFAPSEVDAVGYLMTRFLIKRGGMKKLIQLIDQLPNSRNTGQAVQATYGTSPANLGRLFLQSGG